MPLKNIALGELFKVGVSAFLLVTFQVGFNSFGLGGIRLAIGMYTIATLVSGFFNIDPTGLDIGPDSVVNEKTRKSPVAYLVRTGVSFGVMCLGILIWFAVGILHGVDTTFASANRPAKHVKRMSGDSFFLKMVYLTVSHVTLFSFCRFWMNLYEMVYALYLELRGNARR